MWLQQILLEDLINSMKKNINDYMNGIVGVSYAGRPKNNTVMYITKKVEELIKNLENVSGCVIVVENDVEVPKNYEDNNLFIRTEFPQREYTKIVIEIKNIIENIDKEKKYSTSEGGFFLGENVEIGDGTVIEPGTFIGHNVTIGKNSLIKSGARIKKAVIGDNFIAGENCTIGTNGFTMTRDEDNNLIRIPTLGHVIIGDNVEVGSLTNISCGSAGDTVIEDNVKLDSLVHIGHDVHLHKNVEIPAGAIIGGFDELKENAYVGINAVIKNRKIIGENAVVGMGAVVLKDVGKGQTVVGNPAKPLIK